MDGRTFDDLVRSFASRSSRRRFLRRGVAAAAVAGGLAKLDPTEAARRGYSGTTSICKPVDGGGYVRVSVPNALLAANLATGAILDKGCCAGIDCEGGDSCATGVCDPTTGACETIWQTDGTECTPDGPLNLCIVPYQCQQGTCVGTGFFACPSIVGCIESLGCNPSTGECETGPRPDGTSCFRQSGCVNGTCAAGECLDPPEQECPSDACKSCGFSSCTGGCTCVHVGCDFDPDCQTGHCDPEVGCVFENINEGGPCTRVVDGFCFDGVCMALPQED